MELGIKGHETRGKEVIKLLESLGGVNYYILTGEADNSFYYIDDKYKDIIDSYIGPDEIKGYEIFSLEDFLEKFPYKVGDKVKVWKNYDHFGRSRAELEVAEIKSMRWNSVRCEIAYRMKYQTGEFYKSEIKGKVDDEEQQIDPTMDYVEIVKKSYEEECGKMAAEITMDTLYKAGITHDFLKERGFNLPEGYHFTDENGKSIDVKEIKLVKNSLTYPKDYIECCKRLIQGAHYGVVTDILFDFEKKLKALKTLIVCRNAYWKIAGEQMGLGKPWEPVWDESEDLYTIHTFNGEIRLSGTAHRNAILVFPTEEMRDVFYENFKDMIEQCKELL